MVDEPDIINENAPQDRLMLALSNAQQRVNQAASGFKETGNPVYLWNAIAALTDPALNGMIFSLPEVLRDYLHKAALGVSDAAVRQPKDFSSNVMSALTLTTKIKGHSFARDYAYTQSLTEIIGVYAALELKHGSKKACEMIAAATSTSAISARASMTKALRLLNRIRLGAGMELTSLAYIPDCVKDIHGNILPDGFLIEAIVKGAPHNFWRRNSA